MRHSTSPNGWDDDDRWDEPDEPEYWTETRRPLVCLVFLLPLLAIYEFGVLYFGGKQPETIRNGADWWMRCWLESGGGGQFDWLLPAVVISGLLGWHLLSRHDWRVAAETPFGMLAESLLLAFLLILIGRLTDLAFQHAEVAALMSTPAPSRAATAVTFIGAGIYEEFLFRLCLLPLCVACLRALRLDRPRALVIAVLTTSLAFSLAHYIGTTAETFDLFTFTFRTIAGIFFAMVFVSRGFGIAVGCHATYDLLVGLLLYAQT